MLLMDGRIKTVLVLRLAGGISNVLLMAGRIKTVLVLRLAGGISCC